MVWKGENDMSRFVHFSRILHTHFEVDDLGRHGYGEKTTREGLDRKDDMSSSGISLV
jgi:hypothetical protein